MISYDANSKVRLHPHSLTHIHTLSRAFSLSLSRSLSRAFSLSLSFSLPLSRTLGRGEIGREGIGPPPGQLTARHPSANPGRHRKRRVEGYDGRWFRWPLPDRGMNDLPTPVHVSTRSSLSLFFSAGVVQSAPRLYQAVPSACTLSTASSR